RGSAYSQVARASEVEISLGCHRAQGEGVIIVGHQRMLKTSDTGSLVFSLRQGQQAQSWARSAAATICFARLLGLTLPQNSSPPSLRWRPRSIWASHKAGFLLRTLPVEA